MKNLLLDLPFKNIDLETKEVFKAVASARTSLGELNGLCKSIPNPEILINTLGLQESRLSSEVENIVTTTDDLYKSQLFDISNTSAKEVYNYVSALSFGFNKLKSNKKIITNNIIIKLNSIITSNDAGFRKQSGTKLKNNKTGTIIYDPPQNLGDIKNLMSNLEKFINDDQICDLDPLVKLAIIHHRFESIHPFYDGNGRTGRVINLLYLISQDLLDLPVLYLSRYINNTKEDYYKLLKNIQDSNNSQVSWIEWILYIAKGIDTTAKETIILINKIKILIQKYKEIIRSNTNIYSHELLNSLFKHPYTTIDRLQKDLVNVKQNKTISKYLNKLSQLKTEHGNPILEKAKSGRKNYYINTLLYSLLKNAFK